MTPIRIVATVTAFKLLLTIYIPKIGYTRSISNKDSFKRLWMGDQHLTITIPEPLNGAERTLTPLSVRVWPPLSDFYLNS